MHRSSEPYPKPTPKVKQRPGTGNPRNYKPESMTQEDQLAADVTRETGIPMKRRPMSGANPLKPADVYSDQRIRNPSHRLLLEAKIVEELTSKGAKVLTINLEDVDKLLVEAGQENCLPMLVVQFRGDARRFSLTRLEDQLRLLREHLQLSNDLEAASA